MSKIKGRTFSCGHCGDQFKSLQNVKNHAICKHFPGLKKFKCDLCPMSFVTALKLKMHNNVHSKIKAFTCDMCKKNFGRKDQLSLHITVVHLKIKKYECLECIPVRKFGEKRKLEDHKVLHARTPNACDACDMTFLTLKKLQQHIASQHPQPAKITCEACGAEYAKSSYRRHVATLKHLENEVRKEVEKKIKSA